MAVHDLCAEGLSDVGTDHERFDGTDKIIIVAAVSGRGGRIPVAGITSLCESAQLVWGKTFRMRARAGKCTLPRCREQKLGVRWCWLIQSRREPAPVMTNVKWVQILAQRCGDSLK